MSSIVAGFLAGSIWNVCSLWCLRRLLHAWLGRSGAQKEKTDFKPSKKTVMLWLLVKFPILYLAAFYILRSSWCSMVGFALGFSVVLVSAIVLLILYGQRMAFTR